MNALKTIAIALSCTLFASCMDSGYDEPNLNESPYGNNALTETNVVSIADLKSMYGNTISGNMMEQITDDIQIKGIVTGNDIQGNIYNEVSIDDGTAAFIICIAQGGLYGYLPVGQEILVSLKDLYIGAYGQQGEIGVPYTNASGRTYVSRMSRMLWNQHFKLIGMGGHSVTPIEFDQSKVKDAQYMADNCGRLMVLKGVEIKDADGTAAFAPDDGSVTLVSNCANRAINGFSTSNLVLRTSSYADFANDPMPTGPVDITGIFTRYNNTWQILLRTVDDIKPAISN
ncbi:MAG: hypothetical protein IKT00_08910 [Prevotella sp.]|nr:hypothetical protein [Prevotella sp.]